MAARKLNPFPATPFSGQGMIGRSVGHAVEAFHKASFSAEKVTEVRTELYTPPPSPHGLLAVCTES